MLFLKHLGAAAVVIEQVIPRPPLDLVSVERQLLGADHPHKIVLVVSLLRAGRQEGAH